jgi:hypothetical protein
MVGFTENFELVLRMATCFDAFFIAKADSLVGLEASRCAKMARTGQANVPSAGRGSNPISFCQVSCACVSERQGCL